MIISVITTLFDVVNGHVWEIWIRIIYASDLTHFFDTATLVCKLETRLADAYSTLQSHYVWCKHILINNTNKTKTLTMKTSGPWLSADIQAWIEPPQIPLIKAELD